MKKVICLVTALMFLTGCALSTIKAPKKAAAPAPERRTIIERVREVVIPEPPKRVEKEVEKEEVLPVAPRATEKEEVLPSDEDIK